MRFVISMLGSTAILASGVSSAQQPTPQSTQQAAAQAQAQAQIDIVAKRLCKAEPVVGTRLAVQRRCSTPAELVEYRRQAQEMIQNLRQRPCSAGVTAGDGAVAMSC